MRKAYVVHTQPFHCSYEDGRWATDLYSRYENVLFDQLDDAIDYAKSIKEENGEPTITFTTYGESWFDATDIEVWEAIVNCDDEIMDLTVVYSDNTIPDRLKPAVYRRADR